MDFGDSRSFSFTPDRVRRALDYAADRSGRWMWRDSSEASPQLFLVVGARGGVFYRKGRHHGEMVSLRLGNASGPVAISLAEARRLCLESQYGAAEVIRRPRTVSRTGLTVGEAWQAYIAAAESGAFSMRGTERRPLRAKTVVGYKSHYSAHLSKHADQDIAWLAENVIHQVEEIGSRPGADGKPHPATANQHLQIVRNVFEFLRREGKWQKPNPCIGQVRKFAIEARDCNLKRREAAMLLAALKTEPEWMDLFLFVALSGRRLGNALLLRWDQVDLDEGWVSYPSSRMKANRADTLQITPGVRAILERRQGSAEDGDIWVWPSPKDRANPISNPHHAWERIRRLAKLPTLKIHELRHVAITWAAEDGATQAQLSAMASHTDPRSTARYMHHGGQTATPALEKVQKRWDAAAESGIVLQKLKRKPRSDRGAKR